MDNQALLNAAAESLATEPAFRATLVENDTRRVELFAHDIEEAKAHRTRTEALWERIAVAVERLAAHR